MHYYVFACEKAFTFSIIMRSHLMKAEVTVSMWVLWRREYKSEAPDSGNKDRVKHQVYLHNPYGYLLSHSLCSGCECAQMQE